MTTSADNVATLSRSEWAELAPQFVDHNYRTSWAFAHACASRVGAESLHVAVRSGAEVLGVANVRVRRLPVLGGVAYVNGGPLCRKGEQDDASRFAACLDALHEHFVRSKGLVLRILAPVGGPEWNASADASFRARGFSAAFRGQPYRTFLLDLSPTPEELRKSLGQKWRNCLNSSEKKGLTIESGEEAGLLDRFSELFRVFLARKGFAVDLDADFYARVQENHLPCERYYTSLALRDGEVMAGHVSSMQGDTCVYLLGASAPAGLKTNAAYLLQWHTIVQAQMRGLRWYDLGGIDPTGNPGVFRFKQGLNGMDVSAAGPYELPPSRLRGVIIGASEDAYRAIRGWHGSRQ